MPKGIKNPTDDTIEDLNPYFMTELKRARWRKEYHRRMAEKKNRRDCRDRYRKKHMKVIPRRPGAGRPTIYVKKKGDGVEDLRMVKKLVYMPKGLWDIAEWAGNGQYSRGLRVLCENAYRVIHSEKKEIGRPDIDGLPDIPITPVVQRPEE